MKSIKNKLILTNTLILVITIGIIGGLALIVVSHLSNSFVEIGNDRSKDFLSKTITSEDDHKKEITTLYEKLLYTKGVNLLNKDVLAILPSFQDNSITFIKEFLQKTYALDREIVMASFFVREKTDVKMWHFASLEFPNGLGVSANYSHQDRAWLYQTPKAIKQIADPHLETMFSFNAIWVGEHSYEYTLEDNEERNITVYDCLLPFTEDGQSVESAIEQGHRVGYLRYWVSKKEVQQLIDGIEKRVANNLLEKKLENKSAFDKMKSLISDTMSLGVILFIAFSIVVLLISLFVSMRISKMISKPIIELSESAKKIAEGDYSSEIKLLGSDEIGRLGESFEQMRNKIRAFTENLQGLIYQKTQEISDIMRSINQGIITINLDGSINEEHSTEAEDIFQKDEFLNVIFFDLMECNDEKREQFINWLNLVKQPTKLARWAKYCELNPLKEVNLNINGISKILKLKFEPILKKNRLEKIMVLVSDITEQKRLTEALTKKIKESELFAERVSAVFCNEREEVTHFLEDLQSYAKTFKAINNSLELEKNIDLIFRFIHTLKGSAGTLGFFTLARLSNDAEDVLEKIRAKSDISNFDHWQNSIKMLDEEIMQIEKVSNLIQNENVEMIEVDKNEFFMLSERIQSHTITLAEVEEKVVFLNSREWGHFCRKYSNLINLYGQKLSKDLKTLIIENENVRLPRAFLNDIDGILVQLLKNAVDHGIESDEERKKLNKDKGEIRMGISLTHSNIMISVEDDGRGVCFDQIISRVIEKKLKTKEEIELMSEARIRDDLIFLPGVSTRKVSTEISGRGVGLDVVRQDVLKLGGQIKLETQEGKGTSFQLTFPC